MIGAFELTPLDLDRVVHGARGAEPASEHYHLPHGGALCHREAR
jgi:hypothetical protein